MTKEASEGLMVLWASGGTPSDVAAAPAIRRWILPASRRLDIVSVAPVSSNVARRMTHWTVQQRAQDLPEAEEAAKRTLEALGDAGVAVESHVRWGSASREIVQQADESGADIIVLGPGAPASLQKAVLGSTAEQIVFHTAKSVWLVREPDDAAAERVVLLYTTQAHFNKAIAMLNALRLDPDVPIVLLACLVPVKPFGSMFITLNEEIRTREQATHDARAEVLRDFLLECARSLPDARQRQVRVEVRDCEPHGIPEAIKEFRPALLIVGDGVHADPLGAERRQLEQIIGRLSCSVLVAR